MTTTDPNQTAPTHSDPLAELATDIANARTQLRDAESVTPAQLAQMLRMNVLPMMGEIVRQATDQRNYQAVLYDTSSQHSSIIDHLLAAQEEEYASSALLRADADVVAAIIDALESLVDASIKHSTGTALKSLKDMQPLIARGRELLATIDVLDIVEDDEEEDDEEREAPAVEEPAEPVASN